MDRSERFYLIDRLLRERAVVPLRTFLDELQVSRATFHRDLEYLRERLHAPIEWDAEARGYRLAGQGAGEPRYALPGFWLSASEIQGLLGMQAILADIEPGLLARALAPIRDRLDRLLAASGHSADEVRRRIRLQPLGRRDASGKAFEAVAHATVERRRLRVRHFNRATGEATARELSPQRLVHYRDNWYLDAWCHVREALRSFAVDAIESVEVLATSAHECPDAEVAARFDAGYGIFNGPTTRWAVIRFTPLRARWAAHETWHPQQQGQWLDDGSWQLRLPFSDPRELVWDVLRQGDGAELLEPEDLRAMVRDEVERLRARYAA